MNKKTEAGSFDYVKVHQAITNIGHLTKRFKRNRIKMETYIIEVNKNLASMDSKRNYIEYLRNIGQLN
jgi:hypothetical protein